MSIYEALILGVVQGLTEFLPISSSGHLELGSFFLNSNSSNNLLFAIIVHGATALSTIVIFRKDLLELVSELLKFKLNDGTIYIFKLGLSMLPVGIIGILYVDKIEKFFGGNIVLVASMLLVTGALLLATQFISVKEGKITFIKAFMIGIAQAVAILPGISRSGATISTALFLGVKRNNATRFSFLMVLAPILGALLLKVKDLITTPSLGENIGIMPLFVGFIAAFVSGLVACRWMLAIVKKGKLSYFAIYCFIVGIVVLIAF